MSAIIMSVSTAAHGERGRRIPVLRLSLALRERLGSAPAAAGRVHSVFEHALNIEWHDGALVTLQGPGPLAAPFAAALPWLPALAAAPVRRVERGLRVEDVELGWETAAWVDLALRPGETDARPLARALGDLTPPDGAPGLRSPTGRAAREQLAAGIRERDANAFVAGARALIGLGEGLTPGGDDCLVGALAVLHRLAPSPLARDPEIHAALARAAGAGTTTIGREFIRHALRGVFSEPVIELLTARSEVAAARAAARLLMLGATSGADTLAGIRLALEALEVLAA